jgi:hemolysin activation/secretion protein
VCPNVHLQKKHLPQLRNKLRCSLNPSQEVHLSLQSKVDSEQALIRILKRSTPLILITMSLYSAGKTLTTSTLLLASVGGLAVTAQTLPIAQRTDRLTQPQTLPSPLPTSKPKIAPPQTPQATPQNSSTPITVRKIVVTGSTVLSTTELMNLTQPLEGKSVALQELQSLADRITQLYLERGYITSRAIVAQQKITDGIVTIQVIEGSLDLVEVQGNSRLNSGYILSRVKLGTGAPLNRNNLEDQLQLLKSDPLLSEINASLQPGKEPGKSQLTVRVKEAPALTGNITLDNYSPPSVGAERLGGTIAYRNVTGMGDELRATYFRSLAGGSNLYDFSYRIPVNAMNGTLQFRYSPSNSKIIDPAFASFGIRSQSDLYEITYRQPVIRSPREELALSLGFALQNGQTFLFDNSPTPFGIGPDANGNSRTRVIKFGQDYVRRDPKGAWALQSQFNFGIGAFDATINPSPIPDGRFFSWTGQIQRVQQLTPNQLLIAQADVQLSPNSLLPSQQFTIGGGQSVRGFRQGVRSGDNGIRFSLENRITVGRDQTGRSVFQVVPFADLGSVWNNPSNPNPSSNQNFLASAGLGLIYEPVPRLLMRLDYALPLVNLSDRGNNVQDNGLHFSLGYSF